MKKIILLGAFFLFLKIGSAQYSLSFCESISEDGNPQKTSNSFHVAAKGSPLIFFVKSDNGFDTEQIKFTIYFINSFGNEEEVSSLSQKTESRWNYLWKEVLLFNAGVYRIKVYNSKGTYLTSANLNIKSS